MKRDVQKLAEHPFDLLVVGGGIVGAGVAWDACLRGLSCALIDRGDFAGGTSSKTSKLIHGGLRYLEQLNFKLVRESLREREILLGQAPDLVRPLPFLIPVQGSRPRPGWMIRLGTFLYDQLAGRSSLPRRRFLCRDDLAKEEPALGAAPQDRLVEYYDAQMDDAGLVLAVVRAAAQAGTQVANHLQVVGWNMKGGRICGAVVEDHLDKCRWEVQARVVVNATGPWVDRLRALNGQSVRPLVRLSKGIHLVYPDLGLRHALFLSARRDRRIFFLIPWQGVTLLGTTDTDTSEDPGHLLANRKEVDYLLEAANQALPGLALSRQKLLTTFAGARALVAAGKKDPWAVSRSHLIHEDPNGLISVVGGKFTTFRRMAEETVNRVIRRLGPGRFRPCRTAEGLLQPGWGKGGEEGADWRPRVRFAVQEEMARTLSDLVLRRLPSGWILEKSPVALESAAEEMGRILGWAEEERQRQLQATRQEIDANRRACR